MLKVLTLSLLVAIVAAVVDKEITLFIDPGRKDCFYEHAKAGHLIDIEYQVINGGNGDMDISFEIAESSGKTLVTDVKRITRSHRVTADKDGDYRFCFSNAHSTFNRKVVFFSLIIGDEDTDASPERSDEYEGLSPEDVYELTVEEINDSILRVKGSLSKAKQLQDILKTFEARDRNIVEQNFSKVNSWSIFQVCLMLGVGALQVFMVRSLFDTENRAHKLWEKLMSKYN